jgi:outer membrane biogenesis lipoprotein LolB
MLMEAMMRMVKGLVGAVGLLIVASLAGCSSSGSGPTKIGFTGGQDCRSARAELNKLDAMGVPGKIEAQQSGRKVSAEAQQQIARYNALLESYLGNQCQLPPA